MSLTDITGRLEPGMWDYRVFPGFDEMIPPLQVDPIGTLETDGFVASRVVLSTITGTYLEASNHVLADGRNLDQHPVEDFVRPVRILRLGRLAPDTVISGALLAAAAPDGLTPGEAVIIDTGWYEQWNRPGFVTHCPTMRPDALAWLIEQQIGLLGVDVPAIEAAWTEGDGDAKGGLLSELFARGCLLLAPVVGLDRIGADRGRLIALPIPLAGTSGAPVRAVVEW